MLGFVGLLSQSEKPHPPEISLPQSLLLDSCPFLYTACAIYIKVRAGSVACEAGWGLPSGAISVIMMYGTRGLTLCGAAGGHSTFPADSSRGQAALQSAHLHLLCQAAASPVEGIHSRRAGDPHSGATAHCTLASSVNDVGLCQLPQQGFLSKAWLPQTCPEVTCTDTLETWWCPCRCKMFPGCTGV